MTHSEETIEKIEKLLLDEKKPLHERFRALFTLKNIGGARSVQAIGKCFFDSSALLRHELAFVLGQMQNPEAVPTLISVLENVNENPMVRHEAAEALGAIGLETSVQILKKYINDPESVISETCQIAIARIEYEKEKKEDKKENKEDKEGTDPNPFYSVDPAPPRPKSSIEELKNDLMNVNLSLFERYRAMFALRNLSASTCCSTLSTCKWEKGQEAKEKENQNQNEQKKDEEKHENDGCLRQTAAILALTIGLSDSSPLFRHEIAYVLGQLAHKASIPALVESLQNQNEHEMVRHECAEALGSIANEECLPVLETFKKDQQRVVRESCEVALDMYEYENSNEFQYADGIGRTQKDE